MGRLEVKGMGGGEGGIEVMGRKERGVVKEGPGLGVGSRGRGMRRGWGGNGGRGREGGRRGEYGGGGKKGGG